MTKAGVPQDQALSLARDPQKHHFVVPEAATWVTVARTAKAQLGQALNDAMLAIERANAQAFDLPALAESWRVEYKLTRSRTVGARVAQPGRIVVAGAIDNVEACHAALRRWLARHATMTLIPRLASLASEVGLKYRDVAVKNQRTRWGSCSSTGRISLNCKLLFLPPEQLRYVLLHELCHLIEASHSEKFWMQMRRLAPSAETLHARMRNAWKGVPSWAQRIAFTEC